MAEDDEKQRADARANRERIVDVAREALKGNPEASLNSIAKAAGVGAGTLYRHFPNRESLILAVYRQKVEQLIALAPALLREHSPLAAFRLWCTRLAEFGRDKHAVADAIHSALTEQDVRETYGPMVDAVRQLLQACENAGDLVRGTDPEDVLVLLSCLWRLPQSTSAEEQCERLLRIIFRGLTVAK